MAVTMQVYAAQAKDMTLIEHVTDCPGRPPQFSRAKRRTIA
jgi:hypothetical protein